MNKSSKYLIGGAIIIAAVAFGIFIISRPQSQSSQNNQGISAPALSDIPAPNGWYAHRINPSIIIFTRQSVLPQVSATEGFAYGEQITVSTDYVSDSKDWVNRNLGDTLFVPSKTSSTRNGYETWSAEVNGEQKVLEYVVFKNGVAYVFSLYPVETYDASTKNYVPNA